MIRTAKPDEEVRRPRKNRRPLIVALCSVLVLFTLLISLFLPEVVSIVWHILHGRSVQFEAWEVPVPSGWREFSGNHTAIIQKLGRWDESSSDAIVANLEFPVGSFLDVNELKRATIETERNRGHRLMAESKVQLDGENGLCLRFGDDKRPDELWISCDFPVHRLSVGYIGFKDDSQVVELIVSNIRPIR